MRPVLILAGFILTSCATTECSKVGDYNRRQNCYEEQKQQEYYERTGWRYQYRGPRGY